MRQKNTILLSALAMGICALQANAQVANYALSFDKAGMVNCGSMPAMAGRESYSIQLWICPETWVPGATIMSQGNSWSIAIGQEEGTIELSVGKSTLAITSSDLKCNQWSQITVVCDQGDAKALVNGIQVAQAELNPMPIDGSDLTIGGGYIGRIDEVRLWSEALTDDYNYFINNTLNLHAPQWTDLAAYYKMDQIDCAHLVDYKGIEETEIEYNNHGVLSPEGVVRVKVEDNSGLPYLINGAYTNNERFFDRAIPREQYLLSNDLIILGIESLADGHVRVMTPNNHAQAVGNVAYLAECEGRQGVAQFDGSGYMELSERTMEPTVTEGATDGYTFETWFLVDQWVKDAYLFRKESDDAAQGFSVRLGEEGQLIVRCNGVNYGAKLDITAGEWHHIGIVPRNTGVARTTYLFVYDGVGKSATASLCDGGTDCTPLNLDTMKAFIGENFQGKLDNTMLWNMNFDAAAVKSHSASVPMPGFGITLTSMNMQKANTCLLFDDSSCLGWDSYSQDHWRDIMTSAYDGYAGYTVRISVKSHNGWQNTIADAERRKIFAADLAEISEGYDGVELDLEWMDGLQTNLGLLAREIRAALPEGKTFFISCHAYGAYRFPLEDMALVDGFTFQQYGPQTTYFSWDNYVNTTRNFQNYGFENSKIMTSYATTTSQGSNGNGTVAVSGVRNGFFDAEGFSAEVNSGELNGFSYVFTGPMQTYQRAAYCVENNLQGIFYWDMGNDVPVEHPFNLAKWASYGLNANVDRHITHVDVKHATNSISSVAADKSSATMKLAKSADGSRAIIHGVENPAKAVLYSPLGTIINSQNVSHSAIDLTSIAKGMFVVMVTDTNGNTYSSKFVN